MYRCSACQLAVIVTPDGRVIRACSCNATIIASIRVELKGRGGVR